MKRFTRWRLSLLLVMLALILSGCGEPYLSALRPAGEVAKKQYNLMLLSTVIMVLVILVVTILFVTVILRFRRKDDSIPKQVDGSHKLELIWTIIPIILLIILAVPTVTATFALADVSDVQKDEEALVVNVRASLYWWEFEYPNEGIVTSQEMFVPTDEKIYFNLKASDVKHSFWIPAVGGKLDTNTDNVNSFWLEFDQDAANEAGSLFYGKCAELCGPSHALMDFKVRAVPREEFEQWLAGMKAVEEPQEPETALAKEGKELFNSKGCISCHAVTPDNNTPEAARIGPNLTDFGERSHIAGILDNNEEQLKTWLSDPEKVKPANKMTGTYEDLTKDELEALTKYLSGLKVQE